MILSMTQRAPWTPKSRSAARVVEAGLIDIRRCDFRSCLWASGAEQKFNYIGMIYVQQSALCTFLFHSAAQDHMLTL
jgi:hypothetical protein